MMEALLAIAVAFLVGWAVVWVLRQSFSARCPACRGPVPAGASKCRHCGEVFAEPVPQVFHVGRVALVIAVAFVILMALGWLAAIIGDATR